MNIRTAFGCLVLMGSLGGVAASLSDLTHQLWLAGITTGEYSPCPSLADAKAELSAAQVDVAEFAGTDKRAIHRRLFRAEWQLQRAINAERSSQCVEQ
jgi:hypothetical protein